MSDDYRNLSDEELLKLHDSLTSPSDEFTNEFIKRKQMGSFNKDPEDINWEEMTREEQAEKLKDLYAKDKPVDESINKINEQFEKAERPTLELSGEEKPEQFKLTPGEEKVPVDPNQTEFNFRSKIPAEQMEFGEKRIATPSELASFQKRKGLSDTVSSIKKLGKNISKSGINPSGLAMDTALGVLVPERAGPEEDVIEGPTGRVVEHAQHDIFDELTGGGDWDRYLGYSPTRHLFLKGGQLAINKLKDLFGKNDNTESLRNIKPFVGPPSYLALPKEEEKTEAIEQEEPEKPSLNESLRQIAESPKSKEQKILDYLNLYRAASQDKRDSDLAANMLRAGSIIGAGIAGVKDRPGVEAAEAILKQNQQNLEETKELPGIQAKQMQMEEYSAEHDPASKKSIAMQKLLTSYLGPEKVQSIFGKDIESIPAADAEKILKTVANHEERMASAQQKKLLKEEKDYDDIFKSTDFSKAGSRSAVGVPISKIQQIRSLDPLFKKLDSNEAFTPQDFREAATGIAQLIGGGRTFSQHQIDELTQRTLGTDASKAMQYITGAPKDAGVRKFVEAFRSLTKRELEAQEDILKDTKIKTILPKLDKLSPENRARALQQLELRDGITEDDIKNYGRKDVSLKSKVESVKPIESKEQVSGDDTVLIITPNGTKKRLPKKQLDAALKLGAKVIK
jgi:hypothetical protein